MAAAVEEVSASLVREYLSRKGLKRTIACMDKEFPRTASSINNRSELREILHMDALYRENKLQNSPLKTLLEIIVKHRIEGLKDVKTCKESDPSAFTISSTASSPAAMPSEMNDTETEKSTAHFVTSSPFRIRSPTEKPRPFQPTGTAVSPESSRLSTCTQKGLWTCDSGEQKGQPPTAYPRDNDEKKTLSITESVQKSRSSRIRRGMMAGPIASTSLETNKKRPSRRVEVSQPLLTGEEVNRESKDGLLETGLHQKSFESCLTEISSTDCIGGRQESWSTPERLQSENSFKKVGHDILKPKK